MPSKKIYQLIENNEKQDNNIIGNYLSNISLFIFITCCILSIFLLILIPSLIFRNDNNRCIITPNVIINEKNHCEGKYIYVLDLPTKYNRDFLENCTVLNPFIDECELLTNSGLGPKLTFSDEAVFSGPNWFETDQFSLEVIIHNRIKQYKCLTNDSSHANAIFVPFYSGLDVGRYLWSSNISLRDQMSMDLAKYLVEKPEWRRFGGRDHFLIAGRITWDFGRRSDNTSTPEGWGNHLLDLPEFKNMTTLLLEASPTSKSEMGIPYPTYFHPSSGKEVENWQEKMRVKPRPHLYSFAGAPRPYMKDSLRNVIIDQCLASKARHCEFLHVKDGVSPENIMNLFQNSDFCLQPPGDSYTRKSTFDTILAGCIPVLFHPGSAYVHYIWHLPKDYSSYSVFIPMDEVMEGKVSIDKILSDIPKEKIRAMRENVIKLIPRIIYANPNSDVDDLEDAFDVLIQGVLNRVKKLKEEMEEGKNATSESVVPDILAWKYKFFGGLENNEWDKYFGF